MSLQSPSSLLLNERRLLELRRATRDLENRRTALLSEQEDLAQEIDDLLGDLAAATSESL